MTNTVFYLGQVAEIKSVNIDVLGRVTYNLRYTNEQGNTNTVRFIEEKHITFINKK